MNYYNENLIAMNALAKLETKDHMFVSGKDLQISLRKPGEMHNNGRFNVYVEKEYMDTVRRALDWERNRIHNNKNEYLDETKDLGFSWSLNSVVMHFVPMEIKEGQLKTIVNSKEYSITGTLEVPYEDINDFIEKEDWPAEYTGWNNIYCEKEDCQYIRNCLQNGKEIEEGKVDKSLLKK